MNAQDGFVREDTDALGGREKEETVDVQEEIRAAISAQSLEMKEHLLRSILPDLQPQEGSPANTFTDSELQELQAALPGLNLRPRVERESMDVLVGGHNENVLDICKPWTPPEPVPASLDWYGAPRFAPKASVARQFRQSVREGKFTGPTNGVCPGFLQCNLVVLPQGKHAFDFLLFCQRNPQACPLLEVCDVGSPIPLALAPSADLRTDCPK